MNVILLVMLASFLHVIITKTEIGRDSGFYLPTSERIVDGMIPYKNLALGYTPIGLYAFAGLGVMLNSLRSYELYLGFLLFVQMLSATVLFRIVDSITKSKRLGCFIALIFMFANIANEGIYIVLEPFVVLFALLAVLMILKSDSRPQYLILSGICVSLSFFSKQYGVISFPPLALYLLFRERLWKERLKHLMIFCLGCTIPFIIFFTYFSIGHKLSPLLLLKQLSGSGYEHHFDLLMIKYFFVHTAPFLILFPILFLNREFRTDRRMYLFILLAVFSLFPIKVRQYLHYFLIAVPFLLILAALMMREWKSGPSLPLSFVKVLTFLMLLGIPYHTFGLVRELQKFPGKASQVALSKKVSEVLPAKSRVMMFANPAHFFLCDLLPVEYTRLGYAFIHVLTPEEIIQMLPKADYALVNTQDSDYTYPDSRFQSVGTDLLSVLHQCGFVRRHSITESVSVWERVK